MKSPPRNSFILSVVRILVASLILGTSLFIPEHGKNILQIPSNPQIYVLISAIYLFSLISLALIKPFKDNAWFIFFQTIIDLLFITAFVSISGGVESIFIFLYLFSIVASALFLDRTKLYLIVIIATLFYMGSILRTAPIQALIENRLFAYIWTNRFTIYKLLLQVLALWGVAVLTSVFIYELQKRKSELARQAKEYRQLEHFNENVLRSIESGILTVDLRNRVTYINKAGEQILKVTKEQVIGKDVFVIFPVLVKYLINSKKRLDAPRHAQVILKQPGKRDRVIGFSVSTLLDSENAPAGKIVVFQDLTRYKTMEKRIHESEKLATVGRFAAGLAHEIRNPLASLSSSIQVLQESLNLSGIESELMNNVLEETDRLNRLVTDFLLFSQFGKEAFQEFNLHLLIGEIFSILSRDNRENNINFINKVPNDLEIYSDKDKLKQVFWNILNNAIQAKNKERHIITVAIPPSPTEEPETDNGIEFLSIVVSDNGKGIPKGSMKRIFEPFFTTRPEGTGLGLSIAYQIVSSLGGNIHVTSEEGRGTSVKITIPR